MKRFRRPVPLLLAALASVLLAAPAAAAAPAGERYLVVFDAQQIAADRATGLLEAHGARVERPLFDLGMAIVTSDRASFAESFATLPGVAGVRPDGVRSDLYRVPTLAEFASARVRSLPAAARDGEPRSTAAAGSAFVDWTERPERGPEVPGSRLTQTPFWPFTWSWAKTEAPAAWALGHTGHPDVTVAIIGSGLDYTHPELVGRVDLDRSVNLVPEDAALVEQLFPGAHPIADLGLHSTYVASIITCTAFGQPCYAPNATLVGVKVQNKDEEGTLGDLVDGIRYAGQIGADVIVLPDLYGLYDWRVSEDRVEILAVIRAVAYAKLRGALVVGASWGSIRNELGQNADLDLLTVQLPAQGGTLVAGSLGNDDQWSNFTDYGFSLVDVGAPGGYVDPETLQPPPDVNVFTVGVCSSFTQFTRIFDFPSICNKTAGPQYIFSFGARSAAAEVAGVAALVDGKWQGNLPGVLVGFQIVRTADDVLDPGIDPYSGHGRINTRRALTE